MMAALLEPKALILLGSVLVTLALAFRLGGAPVANAVLAIDRFATTLATIAACLALCVAVVAGMWQVVARFATETPSIWSEALVRTALIWMAMMGLAVAVRTGALVSIDLAHRLSSGHLRRALEAAALAMTLSLFATLVWFGWTLAERVRFQELAGLEISIAWAYAAIPFGTAFGVIGALAHFLDRKSEELENAI